MKAFQRFRFAMLALAGAVPVAVALACTSLPADSEGGRNDDGATSCSQGQTQCASGCTVVATDPLNCGACGTPCAQGQGCSGGMCTCNAPYTACGISCFNTQVDPNNCGSCGNVCPAAAPFCASGACSATCMLTTCAGNVCTDPLTDPGNCGTCGNLCPIGASCAGGGCACPAGTMPCEGACSPTCGSGGSGGMGGGGATSTGGTTMGGAGGSGGSGTAGSASGGTGGMVVQKLCATKVTLTEPTVTDFESYDGTVPAHGTDSWIFTMGPMTAPSYAGLYVLSEHFDEATMMAPATYSLTLAGGANGSYWAARAANTATDDWGGGIGMWMGCINASAFSGFTFFVRGMTPTGMATLSLAMEDATAPDASNPAGGGTCEPAPAEGCAGPSYTFPVTADWTQITVPWATFTAGRGASGAAVMATGDEITGLSFGAGINYVPYPPDAKMPEYVPEPGSFELAVDNVAFTP